MHQQTSGNKEVEPFESFQNLFIMSLLPDAENWILGSLHGLKVLVTQMHMYTFYFPFVQAI